MKSELKAFLATQSGVPSRVAWGLMPQGKALPFVVLTQISGLPEYNMAGDTGFTEYRIQIDVYAETFKECETIQKAIRTAISGKRFATGFEGAFLLNSRDLTAENQSAGEPTFRISADYQISYNQTN